MSVYSVLFVCLGNICRSPLAEGVFRKIIEDNEIEHLFEVDSCGTGTWHVDQPPHPETCRVAKNHGFSVDNQRARQVQPEDFQKFDLIVAMDKSNLSDLKRMRGAEKANIILMREYDIQCDDLSVPDPYYGGADGFEVVYEILHRSCLQMLEEILENFREKKT